MAVSWSFDEARQLAQRHMLSGAEDPEVSNLASNLRQALTVILSDGDWIKEAKATIAEQKAVIQQLSAECRTRQLHESELAEDVQLLMTTGLAKRNEELNKECMQLSAHNMALDLLLEIVTKAMEDNSDFERSRAWDLLYEKKTKSMKGATGGSEFNRLLNSVSEMNKVLADATAEIAESKSAYDAQEGDHG